VLPLLHERQRAEGVERDGSDEPLERSEQQPLIDDFADESKDDAGKTEDRPDHWITSLVTADVPTSQASQPGPEGPLERTAS
jgi:hypothetical protein